MKPKTNKEALNDQVQILLSKPLDIDGTKVSTLTMREPTVNDQLIAAESGSTDAMQEVAIMANLCMVSTADIRKMSLRDYRKLQTAYVAFTS